MLSGIFLIGALFFFPETAREVVGNGSPPVYGFNKAFYAIIQDRFWRNSTRDHETRPWGKFRMPSPLNCLMVLGDRNLLLIMAVGSTYYGVFSVLATSVSTVLLAEYNLNYLTSGRMYLPAGAGGVIAALCTGKISSRVSF